MRLTLEERDTLMGFSILHTIRMSTLTMWTADGTWSLPLILSSLPLKAESFSCVSGPLSRMKLPTVLMVFHLLSSEFGVQHVNTLLYCCFHVFHSSAFHCWMHSLADTWVFSFLHKVYHHNRRREWRGRLPVVTLEQTVLMLSAFGR